MKKKSNRQLVIEELDRMNGLGSKKPGKPSQTVTKLKKQASALLSIIVRRTQANAQGMGFCVTCFIDKGFKEFVPWKKLQAGHFQSGRGNEILFDERGIYPQCCGCNLWKQGNQGAFRIYLEREIGVEEARLVAEDLHKLSRQTRQFAAYELLEMIEGYRKRIEKIERRERNGSGEHEIEVS